MIVAARLRVGESEGGVMKQRYRPSGATSTETTSVIDHGFYDERAQRLRVQPLVGDGRGFVYRTTGTVTRFGASPAGGLSLRFRYA
jgi:hypothetical protein